MKIGKVVSSLLISCSLLLATPLAGDAKGSTDSGEDNAALAEKYAEVTAFLENFDSNVELYWNEDGKISMSLAYSGDLPEGTTITVDIAGIPGTDATGAAMGADVSYSDDVMLYLYYCNPQSGLNEFVSSGIVKDGLVTFDISHCSDYIITDVDHGMSYKDEDELLAGDDSKLGNAEDGTSGDDSAGSSMIVFWILGGAVVIGVLFTAGWLVYLKKSGRGNK